MKLGDLLKKVDIMTCKADLDIDISGVGYDSRAVCAGNLFVAIRGHEFDGHSYISDAVSKGAVCIICEERPYIDTQYIIVENTRKALAIISAAWFGNPADKLTLIGVTGTNGKTTVTTLLKALIEECDNTKVGLIGTNGNYIGEKEYLTTLTTPESYDIHKLFKSMVDENCKYAVMEVSSHALVLNRVYGITFEIGIFTNLTPEHLDFHKTMDEYAKAKSLLFQNSRNSIINIDDEYAQIMINNAKDAVFTYSIDNDNADLVGKEVHLKPGKVEFSAVCGNDNVEFTLNIPGMFSVYNALATVSAALLSGFRPDNIKSALAKCKGVKGRAEVVPTNTDYTVIIDYAHTADALITVLKMARESTSGRVVILFGCGGDRDKSKRPQMGKAAADYSDFVIVTTDNPRTEEPNDIIKHIVEGMGDVKTPYEVIPNRVDAINWALKMSKTDDVLILAGKGHETYQIIGKNKNHFDEREIVAEYFNKHNT